MMNWKIIIICVLGLGIIGSSITLIAKQKALNDNIAAAARLKEQGKQFEDKLAEMEAASSRLKDENAQLKNEVENLKEGLPVGSEVGQGDGENQRLLRKLRSDLRRKQSEFDALKEKYDSLQQAGAEAPEEGPDASPWGRNARRQRFTPEQMEQFMTSGRDRMFDMMDRRIEEAATDYEAGLLVDEKQRLSNLMSLGEKSRTATDEERQAIWAEMATEGSALAEIYNEYDSYQWRSLAEKYGVKDLDRFVEQAQDLSRSRQFQPFGGMGMGPGPPGGRPEGFSSR